MKHLIIAIDGPSGVGKGTVARAVADRLGYRYVDSGALYRAVAWHARRQSVDLDDEAAVSAMASGALLRLEGDLVMIDGHDVTQAIRTPEIDAATTRVARLAGVRQVLVTRLRAMDRGAGLVMEGRDIGTVVFPRADVKVFLDALPEERARRRANDPAHTSGRTSDVAGVASALQQRDQMDRTRVASPLRMADDAVRIDTTGLPIEEVVRRVLDIVTARLRSAGPGI